jgi:GntR family transcriptional regulator/MocR family aminotransferase
MAAPHTAATVNDCAPMTTATPRPDTDAVVIEDDYDAEHRYDRPALGALQALRPSRVLYEGSVSKVLAPALRIGLLVLPDRWRVPLVERNRLSDLGCATLPQATLAYLIRSGG